MCPRARAPGVVGHSSGHGRLSGRQRLFIVSFLTGTLVLVGLVSPSEPATIAPRVHLETSPSTPLAVGLDHVVVAVTNLDAAVARYRELGFVLKPGRSHENGIRNQHVKFPDGTEIELIAAPQARDALTAEYLDHLERGDGPAFVAFFAPEMDRIAGILDTVGKNYRRTDGLLSFPETDRLRYIFFGKRNSSPTDRPEHFEHDNGAEALIGVWLAADDYSAERELLLRLGASVVNEELQVSQKVERTIVRLPEGEIVFLPGSRQLVSGRRIVGATVRTRSLELLQRVLENGLFTVPPVVRTEHGSSMFLSPEMTHGIWLEFRE